MGLADDIINGNYDAKKKIKKKNGESLADQIINRTYKPKTTTSSKTIKKEEEKKDTWFKKSELYDDDKGNAFTDTVGTVGATVGDVGINLVKGVANVGEGVGDFLSYGVAEIYDWAGNDTKANRIRSNAQVGLMDKVFSPAEEYLDKYSVLGEKSDSISQGLGYVAGMTAVGYFTGGVGVTATTFMNGMSNGMTEALQSGASIEEARVYGAISGVGEAVSELMFGGLGKASGALGLSKGIGEFDDMIIGGLTKNIKNKMVKTVLQSGLKAGGEGLEEVVSGLISSVGKKATYMSDKKWSEIRENENVAEQFWMGAITSAIAQGPSTLKSIRNKTDYITGRTENEQKVYDSEVKSRTDAKVRQATIEQAYNEQIKTYENLGIKIKDKAKSVIMQKVEDAYDNGTLEKYQLSKKELGEIENQIDTDMQEGNISIDNIRSILGENVDVKKDNLLMRSVYENEQRYNSYKVETTDNEKVNVLMQSAADAGMNNTSKTRKKVELIAKLTKDTDRQYKFVSPEQLSKMGYREDANGLIDKSTGEILINAKSGKGIQAIVGHETTHIFDSKTKGKGKHAAAEYSKEYQALQDAAIEYAKAIGIYESKVGKITSAYKNLLTNESQIKEELTADLVGDFLFNDEKFIENLAVKNRNIFQRIYDYIKHAHIMSKGTEEEKAFEELKSKFEKVYKTVGKTSNQATKEGAKYSFLGEEVLKNNKEAMNMLEQAKKMREDNEDINYIRQNTGWFKADDGNWKAEINDSNAKMKQKLEKNKTYNLGDILDHETLYSLQPAYRNIKVSTSDIKSNGKYSRETSGITISNRILNDAKQLKSTLLHEIQHATQHAENWQGGTNLKKAGSWEAYLNNYGEKEAREVQNRMNMTYEERMSKKPSNHSTIQYSLSDIEEKYKDKTKYLILSEHEKTNTISINNMVVKEELRNQGIGQSILNDVIEYANKNNKVITLTPTTEFNTQNRLKKWYKANGFVENKGRNTDFLISDTMYKLPDTGVKYSLTDNQGRKLSKEQQEYFKDSKIRDENGNLLEVYHGSYTKDFTIFDINESDEDNVFGQGFYFTDNKMFAENYAIGKENIYEVYLNIKNPFEVTGENTYNLADAILEQDENADIMDKDYGVVSTEKMTAWLKDNGYDGLKIDLNDSYYDSYYYVAFDSNQIKNVDNVNPTENPDIRYSLTDNNGKKLSKEQQEYFKDSKVRDDDGKLLVMYHGSESKFNEFNSSINWFTDSEEYSNYYGRKENTIQKALGIEAKKSKNTYKTYLDIKNPKVLGNIDGYINQDFDVEEFIEESDISREDFNRLLEEYNTGKPEYEKAYRIYELTNSEVFKNYLISQGYDGIKANEKGHTSYGVFNSNQIKNVDNIKPTSNPNIKYSLSEDISKRYDEIKDQRDNLRKQLFELRQERHDIIETIPNYSIFKKYPELEDIDKRMDDNVNLSKQLYAEQEEIEAKIEEIKEQEKKGRIAREETEATPFKLAQNRIIQETNPMLDDYHTGIRSVGDIRTWEEAMSDAEKDGDGYAWGDFTKEDAERALKNNSITIYSSYPIKNGVFVSTSYIQAQQYAGGPGGRVYSKTIKPERVAWINVDEGQYASVKPGDIKYSLSEDSKVPLEQRLSGDKLLDAQDLIEELSTVNANIDDKGYITLYHRTSKENADAIYKSGKMSAKEDGIFFSTSKEGENNSGYGEAIVEVKVPIEEVQLDDIFADEASVRIPLKNRNAVYDVSKYLVHNDTSLSLTNDTGITGDDIAVRDLLKEERVTIDEEVGKTPGAETLTVEDVLNQTPEEKEQGMKEKAKKYLSRSKTRFIEKIVNDFGTSKIANTKTLNSVVDRIREDIQNNGPLTKEKADRYFDELYNNLVTIDTLYYDTYKDVKDNIRATKLYISDAIKNDMSDYNDFRRRNMGTLVMTNDSNNLSVDSYYQEMSDLYPELFPADIINPTDQLERIAEVAKDISKVERNVAAYNDIYEGPDYRDWARAEFDKNINSFMNDMKLAERYNSATNETPKIGVDKQIVKNTYKQIPEAKKKYERALAKELLTKEDRVQVDRLLNNEIDISQIPEGLNRKGIINVATAKQEYDILQKVIKEYQDDIRNKRLELAEEDIGDLNLWKDKKTGFRYSRETAIRNIYDVAPEAVADKVVNKYFRSYIEVNEKKVTDAINGYNDRIKNLDIGTKNKYEITFEGETKKVSESALVQLLGEKKISVDAIKESGANVTKIENAVKEFRNIYNELIAQINESMLDNGYAPVEYRKDYFPHFTEETTDTMLGKAAKLLGIDITNREELPTDIAGQTYKFKPGRTWFSSILQRTTDATDYDALKGFDKYVRGATDLIYHTGDIQNLRALSTVIRGSYNDAEIKNRVEEIKESTMSDLDKSMAIQDIYDKAKDKSHLSKFVEWLDNYTNLLAGKKAINDRGLEKELNRQMYKTMQDIESRIAANAIGGNIGVSLTNFAPISQAWGEVKTTNLINGIWQTMKASVGKDNSFASESQFITRRRGTDTLSETTLEKVTKPINSVLEFADKFTSEVIVRARYNQNLQEGMSPELALQEADRYAAGLMADRGRGALPTQFNNKNPISKMINMFQVEVNNQWSYYTKDLPKHMKEKANTNKTKIVADTAMAYTKIMVGAYLTNELLGAIRGNSTRVLPDPIYIIAELIKGLTDDDDENDDDTVIQTITEIAGNVPFVSLPATLFADSLGLDVGDIGRISLSGAIPNIADITSDLLNKDMTAGEKIKSIGGELLDTVGASLILPYGGSQIKKTIKGLSLYANDLPGSYTDSGDLRYTVEEDVGSKLQAAIFGAYANPYAQDYIDSGFKTIKKDNIDEMVGLDMNSTEYRQFKSNLSKVSNTSDKNGYKQYTDENGKVYWYDADSETMYDSSYKKTTLTEDDLIKTSKTEEALNFINSSDLKDYQKDLAANNLNKNSKKRIDMSEYGKYDSYDEYKYARDYPEKYSVVSQIAPYDDYVRYKDDIADIKERYSTELGYDSDERKAAVQEYINSLELSVEQKMMLEKMAGGYSVKNYKNYIYNYLETLDLTDSEKYTIWEELFN